MATTHKAILWAAIILAVASYCRSIGLDDGASFGITMGLVGAAWGTIAGKRGRCGKGCAR